jgi:DNA-nicking Smr family endonuclease
MSRRRLDPDERSLWKDVTRSIAPLPRRVKAHRLEDADEPPLMPPLKLKTKSKPIAVKTTALAAPRPVSRPEPAPLGRKAKRRLARDGDAIHGRLDLHGMTQAQAHDRLLSFLHASQAKGAKVVLIITGKGARGGDTRERGVLKRQVPMWLRLPEFRDLVVGFESAGIGHGGEGAMYVRIRKMT